MKLLTAREAWRRYKSTATFTQRKWDDECASVYFRRFTKQTWPWEPVNAGYFANHVMGGDV